MSKGFTHEPANSSDYEWFTPPWVFEALGVEFDLDPCHPLIRLPWVPAFKVYTVEDDGLSQPWRGFVWMNPPYGKEAEKWIAKLAEHGNGIALVYARTGTPWFQDYVASASAICFLRKRVRFCGPDGKPRPNKDGKMSSPGADSVLIAWGKEGADALMRCGLGLTIKL